MSWRSCAGSRGGRGSVRWIERSSATDVSESVGPFGFFLNSPSLFPAHDEDWFVIRDRELSRFSLSATKGLMDIYRDGELVAQDLAWPDAYVNPVPGPHTWEIRLRSTDGQPIAFPLSAST
jgi:hypothetical protein